jgi:predicted nuclease of predicted toxin-antitoxin system
VYADNHDAVLISHDIEFGRRRRKNTIGRHLWLRCEEPDAVEVLTKQWDEIEELLEARSHIVLSVSWDKVRAETSWQ